LGIHPRPHWGGGLQCSPGLLAVFRGPTSKERGEEGKEGEAQRGGKGDEGEGKRRGRGEKGWEGGSSSFALGRKVGAYGQTLQTTVPLCSVVSTGCRLLTADRLLNTMRFRLRRASVNSSTLLDSSTGSDAALVPS